MNTLLIQMSLIGYCVTLLQLLAGSTVTIRTKTIVHEKKKMRYREKGEVIH